MKQQLNEIRRMQQLAGILKEETSMHDSFKNGTLTDKESITKYFQTYGVDLANKTLDMKNPISRAILDQMKNPTFENRGGELEPFDGVAYLDEDDKWAIESGGDHQSDWLYTHGADIENLEYFKYVMNQANVQLPEDFDHSDWVKWFDKNFQWNEKDANKFDKGETDDWDLYKKVGYIWDGYWTVYSYSLLGEFWQSLGGSFV